MARLYGDCFGDYFARVHNAIRVERRFDHRHHIDRFTPKFADQIVDLANSDAVLARACALEAQRPFYKSRMKLFKSLDCLMVIRVGSQQNMKVSVTDMTNQRPINL